MFVEHFHISINWRASSLPQVVICGAVPSMVRSVKLYGESSNKFVRINMSGHVYAAEYNETDAYRKYRPGLGEGKGRGKGKDGGIPKTDYLQFNYVL